MTRRNSHLSLAGPKKSGEPRRKVEPSLPSPGSGCGVHPGPSPDPFIDALTEWTDGVIRDLDGATIALRALLERMRRELG